MSEPTRIWKTGERCRIACAGRTLDGFILLASPNGVSLAVEYEGILHPAGMIGGYYLMMPLLWNGRTFRDLGDLGDVELMEPGE